MKIIGITGGVGSGKSKVLDYIKTNYSAQVCQLDEVAKELQKKGTDCYEHIVEVFGEEILLEDGELDRHKLAKIVFEEQKKRTLLNNIVHPRVKEWVVSDINREREHKSFYVMEAALLIEANYSEICDEMWYIYVDESLRRERLYKARGYSAEKTNMIMSSQLTKDEFQEAADCAINNSGNFQETIKQIDKYLMRKD